ncbi:MAG: MmcQ/YjbR family DNA-binding protein [Ignavibacteria bacterium]|jgi:predicted DNA-binding protein (MmcQ/YjbR family)|nr:MmcQ/YjbR family DNA-binding protein [Ignavibacteria bacterium]
MQYDWIEQYLLPMKGVEVEYKAEWDAILYKIGGKIFAMVGNDKDGNDVISMKLLPEYGIELREKYDDIAPGYHLNKVHWNSMQLNGNVPDDVAKTMLTQSYNLVFAGLTKKQQQNIN